MSEITSPIMLDDTGQDLVTEAQNIVTKLQSLINAVKPTAADIPLAPISGMTADDVQEGVAELKSKLADFEYGTYSSLTLAQDEEWTAPSMGVVTGYIRGNTNTTALFSIKSNKVNNNFRVVLNIVSTGSALYESVELFVVKGEKLTITNLSNVYTVGSALYFIPFST